MSRRVKTRRKDPVKRAAKRRAQEAAGYKRAGGKGKPAQVDHASSGRARKKARHGETYMSRTR